jgi:predicted nucleic acid-binding protein
MRAIFDTNIIIDYLNGEMQAKDEISIYSEKCISVITYIEVLVGVKDSVANTVVRNFLMSFDIVNIDLEIAELSVKLRKVYKLKVPDALILASAERVSATLVTRNTKDFTADIPIVRIPYKI